MMGKRYLPAILAAARQALRDEFVAGTDAEFPEDELAVYAGKVLIKISERSPRGVVETVESDGTKEIDLSDSDNVAGDLIGDRVLKVEYPIDNDPPTFEDFTIFGDTLRITDTTPTSGEDVNLYCEEVHVITGSSSSLTPSMEEVLIDGVVSLAATAFLNKYRDQIVPSSIQMYQAWADRRTLAYQSGLDDISDRKTWQF